MYGLIRSGRQIYERNDCKNPKSLDEVPPVVRRSIERIRDLNSLGARVRILSCEWKQDYVALRYEY